MIFKNNRKSAFTLAEVLITLGIIGIVAALTIPTLIQNHNKKVVENRLKKVYSTMNQAITQSENFNGPKEHWDFEDPEFLDKYILPYLIKVDKNTISQNDIDYASINFADGSLLITKSGNTPAAGGKHKDYFFYPSAKHYNLEDFTSRNCVGKTCFAFRFSPAGINSRDILHKDKGFIPYLYYLDEEHYTEEYFLSEGYYSCNKENATQAKPPFYCTALIQYHGWKIPDNYPFPVK